jgi:hypothetical protein
MPPAVKVEFSSATAANAQECQPAADILYAYAVVPAIINILSLHHK